MNRLQTGRELLHVEIRAHNDTVARCHQLHLRSRQRCATRPLQRKLGQRPFAQPRAALPGRIDHDRRIRHALRTKSNVHRSVIIAGHNNPGIGGAGRSYCNKQGYSQQKPVLEVLYHRGFGVIPLNLVPAYPLRLQSATKQNMRPLVIHNPHHGTKFPQPKDDTIRVRITHGVSGSS